MFLHHNGIPQALSDSSRGRCCCSKRARVRRQASKFCCSLLVLRRRWGRWFPGAGRKRVQSVLVCIQAMICASIPPPMSGSPCSVARKKSMWTRSSLSLQPILHSTSCHWSSYACTCWGPRICWSTSDSSSHS